MKSSGVPVVFGTCETLAVLDRCSGVWVLGHWIFPRVSEMGWKEDVSGTGERVLRLVKLEKNKQDGNHEPECSHVEVRWTS